MTAHKELKLLNRNIHLFEWIFGFKFEHRSLIEINNQSLIPLDNIYPEIWDFYENAKPINLLDEPDIVQKKSTFNTLKENKDFKILTEKSQLINLKNAF